ncbi:tRNA epoxyqueuosine(34) reductase QueG [Polycladidibacter hongkongensis]|uniref:tRNA epoxyqueuosine(34) reductase QueG n=1 Tax=Polycladidibacter hongkongensis TaxID=1647556 RepID=UPI00082E381C|nr:tRNA epoxyqueuosine(34) reductase QueG [Pseudovibrio hongkongensis]
MQKTKGQKLKDEVSKRAKALGFDLVRVTSADIGSVAGDRLRQYVAAGYHGSMLWMPETLERRSHPQNLWNEVRSIVVLAMNYGPDEDPRPDLQHKSSGNISVYARNRDYHDLIKGKLKEVASLLASRGGEDVKVFVDTAPVMEKPIAQLAGTGWQGKHTNLVSRELGSWFFLGTIFTSAELPEDTAEIDHCGKCWRCLEACPTNAFPAPYQLDARRCISYLTIEHAGPIAHEFRAAMGNRIYGCDDCLAACPWNKFAQSAKEMKLQARTDLVRPPLQQFLSFDDATFRKFFSGSPIKRIGRNRFIRNCLIAAGNSEDASLIPQVTSKLGEPDAVVRGAAVWALSRLCDAQTLRSLQLANAPFEQDAAVLAEWQQATA